MCGIFGFYAFNDSLVSISKFINSIDLLSHRGPDGQGMVGWDRDGSIYYNEGPKDSLLSVGLGHRRLAIFDLSKKGSQPMKGPNNKWIVFNGDIYNFPELRKELKEFGYTFSSESDTEVILAAYDKWGFSCTTRFNGMWSFAIYDPGQNGIFCSRDRLGKKPFYYIHSLKWFCFASEIAPIFSFIEEPPRIVKEQLAKWLVYGLMDDSAETIYHGIIELQGGHSAWLDIDTQGFRIWRYWDLPEEPDIDISQSKALEHFSELFEDATRIRLRADVPIAVSLSGGIDSSAVTLAASRVSKNNVKVFTSHFPTYPNIDETEYAFQVARACGVSHTLVEPDLSRLVVEEPLLTRHQEMPNGTLSPYVHWAILSQIREQGIPVVLSGQGGDELFLGYERFYIPYLISRFPHLIEMCHAIVQGSLNSRLSLSDMVSYLAFFGIPGLRKVIRTRRIEGIYNSDILDAAPKKKKFIMSDRKELQRFELIGGHLSRLLRVDDRNAGAHGMETRLPFLDFRLVEFGYRLPWSNKIDGGWTKYLIRLYLDRHGLKSIAWRRRKLGFNAPDAEWTKTLLSQRGNILQTSTITKKLLRDDLDINQLPSRFQWQVYNLLHLASLMGWSDIL